MRVRMLKAWRGVRVGTVWVPPWEATARTLVADGFAEPVAKKPAGGFVEVADGKDAGDDETEVEEEVEAEGEDTAKEKKPKKPRKRK